MKICICMKEVANRDTRYQIDTTGTWIKEDNISWEINECDEYALEEGLKIQETHGGEVTVLTIGPTRAEKSMRKGLAMGAHRGIHIVDDERKANSPFAAASALAAVLRQESFDLILAGTQSDDVSYAQTGVMLAEFLDFPHATIVMEIEADPASGKVKALREMEAGWFQWLELPLPAVLTIQAGISQVRYPSLKGIMQAKRKEIRKQPLSELDLDWSKVPRLEIKSLSFPETASKAQMFEGEAATVVAELIEKLRKEARVL